MLVGIPVLRAVFVTVRFLHPDDHTLLGHFELVAKSFSDMVEKTFTFVNVFYFQVKKVTMKTEYSKTKQRVVEIRVAVLLESGCLLNKALHLGCGVSSGQSLVTPHIESLPGKKRLAFNAFLEDLVCGQYRRIDHSSVQQQIQERPLGVRKGQYRG